MPSTRMRRRRVFTPELNPAQLAFLRDEPCPEGVDYWTRWEHDQLISPWGGSAAPDNPGAAELWAQYRDGVLSEWIKEHPGTRPNPWWRFDAPPPRRRERLGGIGTPAHERLAHAEYFPYGVPRIWITRELFTALECTGSPLDVPLIDPDDPPLYESETAYLDRHGLLSPEERRRLEPGDFEPESVLDIFDFGEKEL